MLRPKWAERFSLLSAHSTKVAEHHLQSVQQAIDYRNDVDATQCRCEADVAKRRIAQLEQHSADVGDATQRMGFDA